MAFNKEIIREKRNKLNLTQKDLSDALGLDSSSTISMWENGDSAPRTDMLPRLAAVLGCSIDDLFIGDAERKED